MKRKYILYIILAGIVFSSCKHNEKPAKQVDIQSNAFKEKLIDANKMYAKQESDEIDSYVNHHNWQMTTTGTGLRYMITKKRNRSTG